MALGRLRYRPEAEGSVTPLALAELLVIDHLDDGIEALTAHESDEAEEMSYDDIQKAVHIADDYLRAMAARVSF